MTRTRDLTRRFGKGAGRLAALSWMLVLFLIAWEVYFRVRESLFVPPMSTILREMIDKWFTTDVTSLFLSDFFREHGVASLVRLGWGWGLAIVVGVGVGLVLGRSRRLEASARWVMRFGMATPSTILLPLAVVLFGVTDRMNIFLITSGAVWPVLLNTMDGVRGIDEEVLRVARSLRLPRWRMFRKVVLRAASPQIFAGLRVSLGIALILVVISEIFVATEGIGFDIMISQRVFDFDAMWASVAFMGVLAVVLNGAFHLVERTVLRWHRSQRAAQQ